MKALCFVLLTCLCFGCSSRTSPEPATVQSPLAVASEIEAATPTSTLQPAVGSTYTADSVEAKLGIVSLTDSGLGCLRILNATLKKSDEFYAVVPNERPHVIHKLKIVEKAPKSCVDGSSDMPDSEQMTSRTSYYLAEFVTSNDESSLIYGVGVAGVPKPPTLDTGVATAELTGAPPVEYFRECTGNESILYTVWTGKPLVGKRIWNRMLYLEYGTVPTCTKKDYKGIINE